jgi:hypothetical protein
MIASRLDGAITATQRTRRLRRAAMRRMSAELEEFKQQAALDY